MTLGRNVVFGKVVVRALSTRISLAVLGGAAICAVLTGSWAVTGAAAAVSGVVVAASARRKRVWDSVVTELRQLPPPLPGEAELLDDDSRSLLARLVGAQVERIAVLERHIAPPPERLVPLLSTAAALEEAVVPLLRRYDLLRRYLRRPESKALAAALRAPGTVVAGQIADRTPTKILDLKVQIQKDIMDRADQLRTKVLTIIGALELLPGGLVRLGFESTVPASVEAGAHCDELLLEMSNLERQSVLSTSDELAPIPHPSSVAAGPTPRMVELPVGIG